MQAQRGWIDDEDQVSEYAVEVYNWDEHYIVNRTSCNKCNEFVIIIML